MSSRSKSSRSRSHRQSSQRVRGGGGYPLDSMSDEQRQDEQQGRVAPPEQPRNAWGDPLDSIPSARQDELRALADRQREWAAQDRPHFEHSVFNGARPNQNMRLLVP